MRVLRDCNVVSITKRHNDMLSICETAAAAGNRVQRMGKQLKERVKLTINAKQAWTSLWNRLAPSKHQQVISLLWSWTTHRLYESLKRIICCGDGGFSLEQHFRPA